MDSSARHHARRSGRGPAAGPVKGRWRVPNDGKKLDSRGRLILVSPVRGCLHLLSMMNFAAGFRQHAAHGLSPSSQTASPLSCDHGLDALYRQERATILVYLARKVGHEHAGDLTQEVFIRAASSAQLGKLRNPGGFLRCIARNLAIDFIRRRQCRIVTLPITENVDLSCPPEQEDRLHALETRRRFEEALAGLPAKTARVFVMSRFEHKSYREIHLELGVGVATVEYHMMKALAYLREALERDDF